MLVIDASVFVAASDVSSIHHVACRRLFATQRGPRVVPCLVVAEAAHLIAKWLGSRQERQFVQLVASPPFVVEPIDARDWRRIEELLSTYEDLRLGTVDASIVAAAERLGAERIATLDRRHFGVVRPRHVSSFTLLPHADEVREGLVAYRHTAPPEHAARVDAALARLARSEA